MIFAQAQSGRTQGEPFIMDFRAVCAVWFVLLAVQLPCDTAMHANHRAKRLVAETDVVCDAGTTKIIPPHYYKHNSSGWCGMAVAEVSNDFYNLAYRQECQRWRGGDLPLSVSTIELTYCYEYANGTVHYRVVLCCEGTTTSLRCFSGQSSDRWFSYDYYYGSMNYLMNYQNQLVTCQSDEVCQNQYTFYGSNGTTTNVTMTKGCAKATDCSAVNDPVNGTCFDCKVPTPSCTSCCNTPFCNYNYQSYYNMRPAVCPVYVSTSTTTPPPPQYPCNRRPCENNAYCQNTEYISSDKGYANYTCFCPVHWTGRNCSESAALCSIDNPCLNGGTCYNRSDVAPEEYRCDCPLPYVGDRCELRSNLTCGTSDANYRTFSETNGYGFNCTSMAWYVRNYPERVLSAPYMMPRLCATDGRIAAYRIEFELQSCNRSNGAIKWNTYHSCCYNRTVCASNPCLNGGTCYDYSDVKQGDYRCECTASFVGDNCELSSNLTCNTSSQFSIQRPPRSYGYVTTSTYNCTQWAGITRGNPNQYYPYYTSAFNQCWGNIWRPSDGHTFVQGVDGQIGTDMFRYEVKYCGRNEHTTFAYHYICCPGCLSSPCQNGGYCLQPTVDELVCKCPPGYNGRFCEKKVSICSAYGDPHFRSFDGKIFTYQGTCKYNLASPCNTSQQPYFNVFARSENRPNFPTTVAFPSYVEIVYNSSTVRFSRVAALSSVAAVPVIVTVNGIPVQIPYTAADWSIKYDGQYVRYEALFGLSVAFDGYWSITVNVPTNLHVGKMCGLCGNNDNNPDNDLVMANGTYVGGIPNAGNLVGDSNVVYDPAQTNTRLCPAPAEESLCDPVPESYLEVCGLINSSSNIFKKCVAKLGQQATTALAETCILDACFTNGISMCASIKAFVDLCAFNGIQLPCATWQTASNCSAETFCPAGMVYQCSAPACQATCTDPNAPNACPYPNKDSCVCPSGQFLNNGTCTSNCPVGCLDSNSQLRQFGAQWTAPGCVTYTCNRCVNCTTLQTATKTTGCPAGMVCQNGSKCVSTSTTTPTTTTTKKPKCTPFRGLRLKNCRRKIRKLRKN